MRQKQGGATHSAAVNQLEFGSAIAQNVTCDVPSDALRVARPVFVECEDLWHT